jgi:hypothetical protein
VLAYATALLLCAAGWASAQTPAQRLAVWSQAATARHIARENAARDAATASLKAQIEQLEQMPEVLPGTVGCPPQPRNPIHAKAGQEACWGAANSN